MKNVLRPWTCRNCGRANRTGVELDGKAKCEFCHNEMRIQPSRNRGGEIPGQLPRTNAHQRAQ